MQRLAAEQLEVARRLNTLERYFYLKSGDEREARRDCENLRNEGWFEVEGRISAGAPHENIRRPELGGKSEFELSVSDSICSSVLEAIGGSPLRKDHIMARYSPQSGEIEVQSLNNLHFHLHIRLPNDV